MKVFKYHPELKVCYHDIKKDYENIKYMKNTFEVYDYFLQYTNDEKTIMTYILNINRMVIYLAGAFLIT